MAWIFRLVKWQLIKKAMGYVQRRLTARGNYGHQR